MSEKTSKEREDPQNTVKSQSSLVNVDLSQVVEWLSHCEGSPEHDRCKVTDLQWKEFSGVQFRLVDLQRRCVVEASKASSFVALSYVWGGVNQPMLTSDTSLVLMSEGGLDSFSNR